MTPLAELIGESPGIAAGRDQVGRLLPRQSDSRRLAPSLRTLGILRYVERTRALARDLGLASTLDPTPAP